MSRSWSRELVAALVAVAVGLSPEVAAAQSTPEQMSAHMHHYFRGELDLASAALGLAAGSGYVGGMLLAKATDASRAASIPVLVVGVGEAAIGIGLMVRTGAQVRDLDAQIASAPEAYKRDEGARVEKVLSNFVVLRTIESVVVVSGAATAAIGGVLEEDLAIGAGLGVAVQGSVALCIDALAEGRAEEYLDAIHGFSATPIVVPQEHGTLYGLTLGGRF